MSVVILTPAADDFTLLSANAHTRTHLRLVSNMQLPCAASKVLVSSGPEVVSWWRKKLIQCRDSHKPIEFGMPASSSLLCFLHPIVIGQPHEEGGSL